MTGLNPDEIILKEVRIAYPNVFKKQVYKGQETKYNLRCLIAKDDAQRKDLMQKIGAVAVEKWADKGVATVKLLESKGMLCIRDGDLEENTNFHGHWMVSAANTDQPKVVDRNPKVDLTEADGKIYNGCVANVKIRLWAQDNDYGKRVNAQLLAVQFVRDGEAFGKTPPSASGFDSLAVDDADDELASLV